MKKCMKRVMLFPSHETIFPNILFNNVNIGNIVDL